MPARKSTPKNPVTRKKSKPEPGRALAPSRKPPRSRPTRARTARAAPPYSVPNGIGIVSQHMDYSSHMMDEVKRFYTESLGFAQFRHDPNINYLFIQTGPGSSLGFMPPMPQPEMWRPPGEPAIYLMVVDVDRAYRDLQAKGVMFDQPPTDMPWGHRLALLRDPEGRRVCLAQETRR